MRFITATLSASPRIVRVDGHAPTA